MTLIALLLIVEGLSTGLWIARLVPRLSGYGGLVLILILVRGLVGAMQLAGGVFLIGRRPAAVTLSQWALVASATLTTLEIGERLVPNHLAPNFRWPLVGAYWIYAIGVSLYLRLDSERPVASAPRDRTWEAPPVQTRDVASAEPERQRQDED